MSNTTNIFATKIYKNWAGMGWGFVTTVFVVFKKSLLVSLVALEVIVIDWR